VTNLRHRLRKLEAVVLDRRGLVPDTPEWLEFWGDRIQRFEAGEDVSLHGLTVHVIDAMIHAADWNGDAA
jgi:hypothetical protein